MYEDDTRLFTQTVALSLVMVMFDRCDHHSHIESVCSISHKIIVVCLSVSTEMIWPWDTWCSISGYRRLEARARRFLCMSTIALSTDIASWTDYKKTRAAWTAQASQAKPGPLYLITQYGTGRQITLTNSRGSYQYISERESPRGYVNENYRCISWELD